MKHTGNTDKPLHSVGKTDDSITASRKLPRFRALALGLLALSSFNATAAGELNLGAYAQGVYSGSEPFNTTGTCTDPGDDCSSTDTRVRTADTIQFAWSIAAQNIPIADPDLHAVVMEQTITPGVGADIQFEKIPTICLAPPAGAGGTNPDSSITENPDGSITLLCNLSSMGNGDQKSFSVAVKPLGTSQNGSTFTTSQFVYALDANGTKIINDTESINANTYTISSLPAWDLNANLRPIFRHSVSTQDVGTGRGPEPGFYMYTVFGVGAPADTAGKGISALTDSFSFDFDLEGFTSDGVTPHPFEYKIMHCMPNTSGWGGTLYGNSVAETHAYYDFSVVKSGSCAWTGDSSTGHTFTINDANTSGTRWPTRTWGNTDLSAGPYYASSIRVLVFVPFSEIEREDAAPQSGEIFVKECLNNFDPVDNNGLSNYGAGFEPGYNGAAMPDGSVSNNCSSQVSLKLFTGGSYYYYNFSSANDAGGYSWTPYVPHPNLNDASIEPGLSHVTRAHYQNTGSAPLSDVGLCTQLDNTTSRLTDRGDTGATAGTYAYLVGAGGANTSEWKIEYASAAVPNDDPLDGNGDDVLDHNPTTGRYEGNWDELKAASCGDPALVWNTDPTVIGLDSVNMLRVSPVAGATTLDSGETIYLFTPILARNTFAGGPYDTQEIPLGTIMPTFTKHKTAETTSGNWTTNSYDPITAAGRGASGDRMTSVRIRLAVANTTISPPAPAGTTASTLAGNTVIWQLQPVIQSDLPSGSVANNLEMVDILPAELAYDHSCTIDHPGGAAPTTVLFNTPASGQTTLKWSLGNPTTAAPLDPIQFCTTTLATAPDGTSAVNRAYLSADNGMDSITRAQTVALSQVGSIQATTSVDISSDLKNDDQVHTLRWYNFSGGITVDAPTMINVLPHLNDDTSIANREPVSDFSGTIELTGVPTTTFADGSAPTGSDPFAEIGTIYYSADAAANIDDNPDDNVSNWCEYNGATFINPSNVGGVCPTSFAEVTAIKHVSNYDLEVDGDPRQGIELTYTLQANNNVESDQYTNLFGVDSATLPATQFVKAKQVVVYISSHSIGDWVFVDINNNGKYDPGVDLPAPDGITVEVRDFATGDLIASTSTDAGAFLFPQLPPGEYFVRIPASLFSGVLTDWTAAINGQLSDTDVNHLLDHNAIITGSTTTTGVETDKITLSATEGLPGQAPTGDEPTGDNIIPVADFTTNDDFSNLTIDLGLISADADNDGIADVYEFGPGGVLALSNIDGDSLPDYLDVDSDGDGIPDALEFGGNPASFVDTDGDTIPDIHDIDSDNDGLQDGYEAGLSGLDGDGDGIADEYDINFTNGADIDLNSLDDAVEGVALLDSDLDGLANHHDLDSDNDGLTDTNESNGLDIDGNGLVDNFTDSNSDGIDDTAITVQSAIVNTDSDNEDDFLDIDSDNDGITDIIEAGGSDTDANGLVDSYSDANLDGLNDQTATTPLADTDSDNDTVADRVDFDSDNDTIPDTIEVANSPADGDTDNDGTPDHLDLDSDADGINDSLESLVSLTDTDNDGIVDIYDIDQGSQADTDSNFDGVTDGITVVDTDSDTVANYIDRDSDADGIPDAIEGNVNSDNDGIPNYQDLDSDNDGITDAIEAPNGDDSNSNGIADNLEPASAANDVNGDGIDDAAVLVGMRNTDGDALPDYIDTDSDNDGIADVTEGVTDTDNDTTPNYLDLDSDNDGATDAIEAPAGVVDTDADGTPDYLDTDSDNDGITDLDEGVSVDTDSDNTVDRLDYDSDADGIPDAIEGSVDSDNDNIPDYQDLDSDGDGTSDALEAPVSGVDTDGDGIDDDYEPASPADDQNNDGIDDAIVAAGVLDTDSDGTPDYRDNDGDNDGISDLIETASTDTDSDNIVNRLDYDSDGDTIPDAIEGNIDSDNDTIPDYLDLDSDNDGVSDALEAPVTGIDTDNDGIDDDYEPASPVSDTNNDGVDDAVASNGMVDTDADGIPDYLDIDSDNDGIPDSAEGINTDSDADLIVNRLDYDSDNDGIPDAMERDIDSDNDSIPNYLDLDSDNDGFPDAIEAPVVGIDGNTNGIDDTLEPATQADDLNKDGIDDLVFANGSLNSDGDFLPNYIDIDSDNDGIADLVENAGIDSDGNGQIDGFADTNSDGLDDLTAALTMNILDEDSDTIPNYLDSDSDADGITDAIEGNVDTDNDTTPDYLDLDSDNDGSSDSIEAPSGVVDSDSDGTPDYIDLDSDNDGISDLDEGISVDTDSDTIVDRLDLDSDSDGVPDAIEGDADIDNDSLPNYRDLDSDGDSVSDTFEASLSGVDSNNNGIDDEFEPATAADDINLDGIDDAVAATGIMDSDNDGTPDYLDADGDNDGISDLIETASIDSDSDTIVNRLDYDSDGDSIPDAIEGNIDSDNDTIPNYLDLDSDNDGISDAQEAPVSGVDSDGDGIDNDYEPANTAADANNDGVDDTVAFAGMVDTDNDTIPDYLDIDSDNDGISDTAEGASTDTDNDSIVNRLDSDSDGDGVSDAIEGTVDTDNDGLSDYIDIDSDNDGISDLAEGINTDSDTDVKPNRLDYDSDGDGIPDAIEGDIDTDNDSIPNYLDLDSDNDGIPDSLEAPTSGEDTNTNGIDDAYEPAIPSDDLNNDGIDDAVFAEGVLDSDGDSIPDYIDTDSDDDGIFDIIENAGIDSDGNGQIDIFIDNNNDGLDDLIASMPLILFNEDSDLIPNYLDTDSDSDGIPDAIEGNFDTDNDTTPNYLDIDSDGDGITDAIEGLNTDSDNDSIVNRLDTDSDGDGISDAIEGTIDSDNDSVPNYLDLDSDNDGLPDESEAPVTVINTDSDLLPDYLDLDSDGDGIFDLLEVGGVDADNNGVVDNFVDMNVDGLDDLLAAFPLDFTDSDTDNNANNLDTDSDNDGIPDEAEGNIDSDNDQIPNFLDVDSDNDRIPDALEGTNDSDADSIPDYLDFDSDNDGISDFIEASISGIDTDGDGIDDDFEPATAADDSNGDGIDDAVSITNILDTDNDSVPNYLDLDSDNDGLFDIIEANGDDTDGNGRITSSGATNTNGIDGNVVATLQPFMDSDNDGTPDRLDLDSDNDGLPDSIEAAGNDLDINGLVDQFIDTNGNGVDDAVDAAPYILVDTDGDALPDYRDTDSDNDGIVDNVEAGALDSNTDGFLDAIADTDNDSLPDHLDLDSDADGIPDSLEGNMDSDDDGIPNYLDLDSDNDGLPDSLEAPTSDTMALAGAVDTDNDGVPDYLDLDSDNDQLYDTLEAGSTDADGNGLIDSFTDTNEDGMNDSTQTTPLPDSDEDQDGFVNRLDRDSDNDGLPDAIEGNSFSDADELPDYLDTDSDNDGVPDGIESHVSGNDSDNDQIDDSFDVDQLNGVDANDNGVDDTREALGLLDSDADSIPNALDSDSDADGIPDVVEAGTTPSNPLDSDNDGIWNLLDADSDQDGIPDTMEETVGDTDVDNLPDMLDTDSDGDGIPDGVEARISGIDSDNDGIDDTFDVDSTGGEDADNDGVDDALELSGTLDSDNDGIPNLHDLDSDGDGISDALEAGNDALNPLDSDNDGVANYLDIDSDGDGIEDRLEANGDADNDGIPDYLDNDTDNDGLSDTIEGSGDSDSDGIPDYLDLDSDGDTVPDAQEAAFAGEIPADRDGDGTYDYLDVDADNDGISDLLEGVGDKDGDGIANFRDLDSDNDGIYDLIESRLELSEITALDSDLNGMIDPVNFFGSNGMADIIETIGGSGITNYLLSDIDGDSIPDFLDQDSDNDGIVDTLESDHPDDDLNGTVDARSGADLFFDVTNDNIAVDNFGLISTAGGLPRNTDADALADFRDADSDNDGLSDVVEAFGVLSDMDQDGRIDNFEDADGNGVDDTFQAAPSLPTDTDEDGVPDTLELDSDSDGITDIVENGGIDEDADGQVDNWIDLDNDGLDDSVALFPIAVLDTDSDGIPDYRDLDSDDDGFSDLVESGGVDEDGDGKADLLIAAANVVDSDGDGTPDHLELPLFRTGLSASGCSIATLKPIGSLGLPVDPMLPGLTLLAGLYMLNRRRVKPDSLKR